MVTGSRRGSTHTRARFGIDAPRVVGAYGVVGTLGIVLVVLAATVSVGFLWPGIALFGTGWSTAGLMLHSSLRGKRHVRDRALNQIDWRGDEDVVDLGTGRGLMLLGAAARAPAGTGIGVDVWRSVDQSGSRPEQLLANASALNVGDRVRVVTADMSQLPLTDRSADVVLACMAIHNIHDRKRRRRVIMEAARVLRPGGRLVIIDFAKTAEYVADARQAGLTDIARSRPTAMMWPPVRTVTATMPM